jgi:hypothetical protein
MPSRGTDDLGGVSYHADSRQPSSSPMQWNDSSVSLSASVGLRRKKKLGRRLNGRLVGGGEEDVLDDGDGDEAYESRAGGRLALLNGLLLRLETLLPSMPARDLSSGQLATRFLPASKWRLKEGGLSR